MLEQIRQVIERDYIEEIDLDEQLIGAIRGMTDALDDPYTSYFTPEEYKEFITQTQGSYAGIGLWVNVDEEDNRIYVIKAFKDSPADKAGIHQGDKIVKVEDTDVDGSKLEMAVNMMRGEPGTTVNITILRGEELINVTLERQSLKFGSGIQND